MPYQTKTAPSKIVIDKLQFNQILNFFNSDLILENDKSKVKNLTDKMLKYSLPFKKDNIDEMISIHFYTGELKDFADIMLKYFIYNGSLDVDYYFEALKLKEEYKKSKHEAK